MKKKRWVLTEMKKFGVFAEFATDWRNLRLDGRPVLVVAGDEAAAEVQRQVQGVADDLHERGTLAG